MMLQHEFTMRENLRFSDDGGNEDKSCLGMSLPNVVSGGSDTFVIDSTTVSKKKENNFKNCQTFSYSELFFFNTNTPHSLKCLHHIFTDRTMSLDKKKQNQEWKFYKTNPPTNIYVLTVINWLSIVIMSQYLDTTEKLKSISVFREPIIMLRIQEV